MRSLQVRIALILVASIIAVVFVATAATFLVLSSGDNTRMIGPVAERIASTSERIAGTGGVEQRRPREQIADAPAVGTARPDLTTALEAALVAEGAMGEVRVTELATSDEPVASYKLLDGRWLISSFPHQGSPPAQLWIALANWLLLIVVGVVAVALIMARRVTQPFAMLERAVASVGSDGVLPHIPETGSGELRQTASALNLLSDRLKAAMDSRMRLVAAAGHDLRTPMTRMRLRAEFLPDEERDGWTSDIDELELIADSAIRLVREEGPGEDQVAVNLATLVDHIVSELKSSKLPVTLGTVAPASVKAGPLALRRALRNLVTNAATHGGGARVWLSTTGTVGQIVIDDDGPGIPEALMTQVFEPFFRAAPGRTRTVKGAGLGMAIAKEIVERIGGTIEIENRPGGGLRQTVTLNLVLP